MKDKIKLFTANNKYILLTGLASLFIILFVFFCHSIIPFGDRTIYRMDLYHQYGPLFSELYDRIVSGESLLYSWNSGLGSSFVGNLFNYLSSPFAILIFIFGHEHTFEAVATMIACKAVLSSMSMAYYLKKSHKGNSPMLIAFGVMYAFCGYFIAYYWNVMWMDAMYLFPFVILGIERIINTGKCSTYIVALTLSIFTNYYIGYMICIFSCIYFLYFYYCSLDNFDKRHKILQLKDNKKNIIKDSFLLNSGVRFALSSLCVGILLLGMLLPVAYVLSSSSATSSTFPSKATGYFDFIDFLANHTASLEPTIRSSGEDVLPNIYCGIFTIILIPIYLLSKKISSKEKVASVVLLFFMYCSFNINILNFMWHGFHFPNDLPYRQSFMYSFILLVMAHKAFTHILDFSKKHFIAIGGLLVIFLVVIQRIGSKNVSTLSVVLSVIFILLLTIALCFMTSKKNQIQAVSILLVCIVLSETIVCSTRHYVANQVKQSYMVDYADFKSAQDVIDTKEEDDFYRIELSNLRARMDPSWYDYNGVSVFSSMAYEHAAKLQKSIGVYSNNINSYTYNPNTPVYNSMFSLKYVFDRKNLISDSEYYKNVYQNDTYTVYENNYYLGLAYPVSSDILEWNSLSYLDPIDAQEAYFSYSTGIDDIFYKSYDYNISFNNVENFSLHNKISGVLPATKIDENSEANLTIDITAKENKNIYIYIQSRNLDEVEVKSDIISTTMDVKHGYILDLGVYDKGDIINITLPLKDDEKSADIEFYVFTMDNEKFLEGYNKLKSGQMEISEFNETKISGTFVAEENEILYTSIPYDKGWNIILDGERVSDEDIIQISGSLIGVKVSSGEHNITFEYSIPYINVACLVSFASIIILLIGFILKKKKLFVFKNMKENLWERSDGELPVENFEDNEIISESNIIADENSRDEPTNE